MKHFNRSDWQNLLETILSGVLKTRNPETAAQNWLESGEAKESLLRLLSTKIPPQKEIIKEGENEKSEGKGKNWGIEW